MRGRARLICGVACIALLAAACDSGSGGGEAKGRTCNAGGSAKKLLACVSPALAFIETANFTGSGVLLGGGYVVTNAHVIDPYAVADVTFEGGESHQDVKLVGVDLMADIAVLGPVKTKREGLGIGASAEPEKGDDVFLVGYPGEVEEEPDPAVSEGILSRVRTAKDFGLTFYQTDAAIGEGQSGGALVDATGRVLGISGLSFADEFALAISGTDVARSVARIRKGKGDPYKPFPDGPTITSGSVHLADQGDARVLAVPAADDDRTVRLTVSTTPEPAVVVIDLFGEPLLENAEFIALAGEVAGGAGSPSVPGASSAPVSPGVYEFELPAQTEGLVAFQTRRAEGTDLTFEVSVPVVDFQDSDQGRAIKVGERKTGILDTLEESDTYLVELGAGEKITIRASSPTGDMTYLVRRAGQPLSETPVVDDSDVGLLGYDAEDDFTAGEAGTYIIQVSWNDGVATGYALAVTATKGKSGGKP